jgi:hypothetical protein
MLQNQNLPSIQKKFVSEFDGSLLSVLNFKDLPLILNPVFSAHYFYVSGDCDENIITTKDTDGSFAFWGNQTRAQMDNAYILANEIRAFILSHNPKSLEQIVNYDVEAMRPFAKKISTIRKRAAFIIDGQIVLVPGLKLI